VCLSYLLSLVFQSDYSLPQGVIQSEYEC